MFGRLLTVGLVCFLLGTGAAMFFGPWLHEGAGGELPACPYLAAGELSGLPPGVVAAAGAYEAIRETLARGSLDGVAEQADVIARAFGDSEPQISSCAKRLAGEQDVESARRAFLRLHRLMEKHARRTPAA
jgi:hypothetical protein